MPKPEPTSDDTRAAADLALAFRRDFAKIVYDQVAVLGWDLKTLHEKFGWKEDEYPRIIHAIEDVDSTRIGEICQKLGIQLEIRVKGSKEPE